MNIFHFITAPFRGEPKQLVPGVQVTLGTKVYTVAPMNLATVKKISPMLSSFEAFGKGGVLPSAKDYDNICTIIMLAIQRNHPKVTFKEVEKGLDMANMLTIAAQVMNVAGAVNKGEAAADNR